MSTPVVLKARETARLDEQLAAGWAIVMATVGPAGAAQVDLDVVVAGGARRHVAAASALRAESVLRQGRWEAARAEAADALCIGPPGWPAAMLAAVAWGGCHPAGGG